MDASHEGDVIVKGRLQNFRLVYKLTIMPAKYQKFQSYQVSSFFFFGPALEWRYIFPVTLSCYKKCDESFFGVEILSGKAFNGSLASENISWETSNWLVEAGPKLAFLLEYAKNMSLF